MLFQGFDKVGPEGIPLLQISYWRGVREALEAAGVEVLIVRPHRPDWTNP